MSGSLELGGPQWGWTGKPETELLSRKTACELELGGLSVVPCGLSRDWGLRADQGLGSLGSQSGGTGWGES